MQLNIPIFDDVIIFQLDENPVITKMDKREWKLHVKNDENWKVFGCCKVLWKLCKDYEKQAEALNIQNKKNDDPDKEEEKQGIGLYLECETLVTRIQYLFNFIMNYRSRYGHQIKNKKTKFLLDEHQSSY